MLLLDATYRGDDHKSLSVLHLGSGLVEEDRDMGSNGTVFQPREMETCPTKGPSHVERRTPTYGPSYTDCRFQPSLLHHALPLSCCGLPGLDVLFGPHGHTHNI